jgi:hypothetical protein
LRNLGLALAGLLALSATMVAHADPLAPASAGAAPAIVRVLDGIAQGGSGSGWHAAPGHMRHWNRGWVPPRWGPNGYPGGWGPYGGPRVPTYWVWGPSGGAFDYPFADWRGPTGGWGNPQQAN